MNNIGRIYEDFGETERALGYYVRSNEILDALLRKIHPGWTGGEIWV